MDDRRLRSRPGVTPRPRGEERRRIILRTARALFAEGGFNTVSLADIAREVGITQAGILHYFPTKAALLLAVLQERDQENQDSLVAQQRQGATPLESYVGMLAENDEQPDLVKLFVILSAESSSPDHPAHEWFRRRHEVAMNSLTHDLRLALDATALPPGVTPDIVARWLLALSHGLGAQSIADPDSFDRASLVALFLDMLTRRQHIEQSNFSTINHA